MNLCKISRDNFVHGVEFCSPFNLNGTTSASGPTRPLCNPELNIFSKFDPFTGDKKSITCPSCLKKLKVN